VNPSWHELRTFHLSSGEHGVRLDLTYGGISPIAAYVVAQLVAQACGRSKPSSVRPGCRGHNRARTEHRARQPISRQRFRRLHSQRGRRRRARPPPDLTRPALSAARAVGHHGSTAGKGAGRAPAAWEAEAPATAPPFALGRQRSFCLAAHCRALDNQLHQLVATRATPPSNQTRYGACRRATPLSTEARWVVLDGSRRVRARV